MRYPDLVPPPTQDFERPACPHCGTKMWLRLIEPDTKPGHDARTFVCLDCDHSETLIVKFR